mmetsp:Transcript_33056/g.102444  ORF Transcript_33056/g.102444 Transcript_33056/m.102444 type:complete len:214 (-) Transcript_33056:661-1302(-)
MDQPERFGPGRPAELVDGDFPRRGVDARERRVAAQQRAPHAAVGARRDGGPGHLQREARRERHGDLRLDARGRVDAQKRRGLVQRDPAVVLGVDGHHRRARRAGVDGPAVCGFLGVVRVHGHPPDREAVGRRAIVAVRRHRRHVVPERRGAAAITLDGLADAPRAGEGLVRLRRARVAGHGALQRDPDVARLGALADGVRPSDSPRRLVVYLW